ncbi:MAG: DUF4340 domain-containing protein [Phycisphaerales bacterium]|nr:DUF4340 domain-containing protein [Phycisphaerales bacterium]
MNWRMTLGIWMAALALWFGAWSLWNVATDARANRVLQGFAPVFPAGSVPWNDVDRIEISSGDRPPLTFTRTAGQWSQTTPFVFRVDASGPQQLIAQASTLIAQNVAIQSDASSSATGLDEKAATIAFAWEGGEARIRLGGRLPAGKAWIDLPSGAIGARLAPATLHDLVLARDLVKWRQTALFSRADIDCNRIVCESLDRLGKVQRLEVAREGAAWMVISPIKTRADRAAVERWLEALARTHASGFVADLPHDLLPFGLETPAASLEIHASARRTLADGQVVVEPLLERLEIGAPVRRGAQEHFARLAAHPEAIMEIDGTVVAAAIPPSLLMIDPTASGLRPSDIRAVRVEPASGVAVRLERVAGEWNAATPAGVCSASTAKVAALLARLCDNRATEIMLQVAPADLVIGKIVLESFDGRDLAVLTLSRERDGGRFGIDDGSGVLRIYPAALDVRFDLDGYTSTAP